MAGIFHTTSIVGSNHGGFQISADAWNEEHTIENDTVIPRPVIVDPTTPTKKVTTDISGATILKTTTLVFAHTDDRSITFPNATTTLAGLAVAQTFTQPQQIKLTAGTFAIPSGITVQIVGDSVNSNVILLDNFALGNSLVFRRANTSLASPSAVQADDQLGNINAQGYGATGYVSGGKAAIIFNAAENWTDTASGTYARIMVTPKTTTALTEVMRWLDNGDIAMLAAKKFFLDGVAGAGDTYLYESSANVLDIYVGGVNTIKSTSTLISYAVPTKPKAATGGTSDLWVDSSNTGTNTINTATSGSPLGSNMTQGLYFIKNTDSGAICLVYVGSDTSIISGGGTTEFVSGGFIASPPTNAGKSTIWVDTSGSPYIFKIKNDIGSTQHYRVFIVGLG